MSVYEYNICNVADENIYRQQCKALEKAMPDLIRVRELEDVDGGRYMKYSYKSNDITVKNSVYLDGVYVISQIPLEPFFPQST